MKTYLASLGCPKNLVDSEAALTLLRNSGCSVTGSPRDADLLIVNACSFLDIAWQETVEEVERLSEVKEAGHAKKLIVMGCLPKHRHEDLQSTLPLVDHFIPAGAHERLPALIEAWRGGDPQDPVPTATTNRFAGFEERVILTPPHTAYVKIAEGCSRRCSFCAIPRIRGKMVSRSVESIVREVENLRERGVKEVSLLAQDITSYRSSGRGFVDLVDAIASTGVDWIRIFYVHPGSISRAMARELFRHPSVCRYLECPVQHASDRVLKRMRRPYTQERLRRFFDGVRTDFPDVRIRSEVIVGFPGESDSDFDELKQFVDDVGFATLGIFRYSPESNTPAARLDGRVPADVAAAREEQLRDVQQSVALSLHDGERGRAHTVLVDRRLHGNEVEGDYRFAGRYYGQALDVDGEVLLAGAEVEVGGFVTARVTEAGVYDLKARIV